jgi:hypothetical protein
LGYATFRRWRLFGQESLAGSEAALWLQEKSLTIEHAGERLSRYEVRYEVEHEPSTGKLRRVGRPTLFETSFLLGQPRLFDLAQALGEEGWLKALKLGEYVPRKPCRPGALQQVLFAYTKAI